jgi:hypothetical protein
MPQSNNNGCKTSKKKKGRAPAHQNTFAFKHNPKSKKTDAILNSPNTHVCRRCHDKIEWRKKYRKYKPRTQPGKCTLCSRRNIKAAYHILCETCTTSEEAFANLMKAQQAFMDGSSAVEDVSCSTVEETSSQQDGVSVEQVSQTVAELSVGKCNDGSAPASSKNNKTVLNNINGKPPCQRVCAMCTKEPALPDQDEEKMTVDDFVGNRRLKLRERRALERKLAKEQEAKKPKSKRQDVAQDDCEEEQNGVQHDEKDETTQVSDDQSVDDGSDTEDDLIKAVGGQDKLLTGEAYQKMLLEREQQGLSVGGD